MAALRWLALSVLVSAVGAHSVARAEQVTLVDVTYTHGADNTKDSHFYVTPSASTPKDWTTPTNFAGGSLHYLLEVKTKPSTANTKLQACFEKGSSAACAALSKVYTKPTTLEWDDPEGNFWNASTMDWSKGVDKIALILKDDKDNKVGTDAKYVPTDLHVVLTLVSAGAKYTPMSSGVMDAGVAVQDAGARDAEADARVEEPVVRDAGSRAQVDASTPKDASLPKKDAAPIDEDDPRMTPTKDEGCNLAGGDLTAAWALALWLATRRRAAKS